MNASFFCVPIIHAKKVLGTNRRRARLSQSTAAEAGRRVAGDARLDDRARRRTLSAGERRQGAARKRKPPPAERAEGALQAVQHHRQFQADARQSTSSSKRLPRPRRPCWCSAKAASARNWWRTRSTTTARAPTARSSSFNCAALPESIVESELFGHEKGSFTGAVAHAQGPLRTGRRRHDLSRRGRRTEPAAAGQAVARAAGTNFRARRRRPSPCKVDLRIIAATNRDLLGHDGEGNVPRGPLLSPERVPDHHSAAARARAAT